MGRKPMTKILILAVPGALVPHPTAVRRFLGWERCSASEAEHTIPTADGGLHLRRCKEPVEVDDHREIRLSIARGELELATAKKPTKAKES
jgi:hypothetical protein